MHLHKDLVSAGGRYHGRMPIVAHPGGWWELLIPLVIGFGLVLTLRLSRRSADERSDEPPVKRR